MTLLLLISFASINAVLFTPALPEIAHYFAITDDIAQLTISWFLVGYAFGQLIYGPIANRFGRKPAMYMGISLQIISSLICVLAGATHQFWLLVAGRFLLALGSGVGLKISFTLVNETAEPKRASQILSYLMLAFAITPGLGVALGGFLIIYWDWTSCFYAGGLYGLVLLFLVKKLPETVNSIDINALKISHLFNSYSGLFQRRQLILGALLMGCTTCVVYLFAAEAPFIAINLFGMSSANYGLANCLPSMGLLVGSLVNARLISKNYSLLALIKTGIVIVSLGALLMLITIGVHLPVMVALFFPVTLMYFGICFILANASAIAMSHVKDKAHGSSVMSFVNMGLTTLVVLGVGIFPTAIVILPLSYVALCFAMLGISLRLK